jgi:hypothetical protein
MLLRQPQKTRIKVKNKDLSRPLKHKRSKKMSIIKLPDAKFLASFVQSMKSTGESPCGANAPEICQSSTVKTCYALAAVGMKFNFYNGRKCPHGHPTSGGQLGYILDNYAAPAVKAPCDPGWKSLLHGSVALLMYHHALGDPKYNPIDLWCIDGSFLQDILEQGAAKSIWIWTLGNVSNSKIKSRHSRHSAKHAPMIF